ncbi:uncharacterized protein LACBIDRAFT_305113 [Laccaria bicolor S238N-H82]|uniref:Predicted protein n=1 Tax=Laccaria bicolor (strain S238N-H82 / ATCC MYA-4686) TaxID=486041 RepID=B0CTG0_LACBS|nr:uncharacterized protein LACBIDRAFT_305113 [Laccaria bicolor S238N-H82]EDR14485.1 predicted protein [Laccaria bicolor S238N-H82]|eukprot:XP_001875044.1 predicted protein [Laccaria bicolor S238N-H82]
MWSLLAVDDVCGRWWPQLTVVTWRGWVAGARLRGAGTLVVVGGEVSGGGREEGCIWMSVKAVAKQTIVWQWACAKQTGFRLHSV